MSLNKLMLLAGLVLQSCWYFAVSQRCSNSLKNNYGRRFFLSEMRFTGQSPPHESYPITVRVISSTAGYVYVTAPGCNLYHQRYSITPNVSEITITPKNVTGTTDQERIGILLESTVDTAMFVLDNIPIKRYAVDGFMLLPEEFLGLSYVVAAYSPNSEVQHCIIVGTQNNTSVDITFKSSVSLRLGQFVSGQTYKNQIMRRKINFLDVLYLNVYGDISGSIVNSDKPVAVISDVPEVVVKPNNTGGKFDELNSQLFPVSQWGKVYIVPPIYPRSKYMVRVFAYYNNTHISFYSSHMNTWSVLLNNGEFREYEMGMYPLLAKGDREFSIFQISYSSSYVPGGEGSMTLVPAIGQFSTGPYVISTLHDAHPPYSHFTNYISVVTEKQYKDHIKYNGTRLAPVREQTVPPPYDNYVVLSAALTTDTVHILSSDNPSARFAVLVYGISSSLQYGYLAGLNFQNTDCMTKTTTSQPPITETDAVVVSTSSSLTGRKMRCFSCAHLPHLRYCDSLQECQDGQVCFVERKHATGGHFYYSSGCTSEDSCPVEDTTTGNHGDCFSCCKSDFCNNKGCLDTGLPALSQRGPYCFDCQNFDRPTTCDRAVLCADNEVCSIEQYHWGGTESIYKMGCLAKHSCPAVGRHSSRSVPVCHSCCETDFCNDNCTHISGGIQIIG